MRIDFHIDAPPAHGARGACLQVGANTSSHVTKVSSLGMWAPVHDEEWDGDVPLNLERAKRMGVDSEEGTVVFDAGKLPWRTGRYEVRPTHLSSDSPSTSDFLPRCLDSLSPRWEVQRHGHSWSH